jgi:hypothetical protein
VLFVVFRIVWGHGPAMAPFFLEQKSQKHLKTKNIKLQKSKVGVSE